jgi:hypothetical protein
MEIINEAYEKKYIKIYFTNLNTKWYITEIKNEFITNNNIIS